MVSAQVQATLLEQESYTVIVVRTETSGRSRPAFTCQIFCIQCWKYVPGKYQHADEPGAIIAKFNQAHLKKSMSHAILHLDQRMRSCVNIDFSIKKANIHPKTLKNTMVALLTQGVISDGDAASENSFEALSRLKMDISNFDLAEVQ
jgi:hypothetical protein